MREAKNPFGERDGVPLRAFEVANGLACDCVCPGCRKPLSAANRGQKVIPHFRHAQAKDCVRGYKDGGRRAAVALIAAQQRLTLPAYSRRISATTTSGYIHLRMRSTTKPERSLRLAPTLLVQHAPFMRDGTRSGADPKPPVATGKNRPRAAHQHQYRGLPLIARLIARSLIARSSARLAVFSADVDRIRDRGVELVGHSD